MNSIFAGLRSPNLSTSSLDPKRLFRALPKVTGSKFKFPHDIQTEVWDKWFRRRNESDLILKMNTGSGKTVVGLLIAKSSLNEGKGPAVYLVPDHQLKSQVGETADELGISWTDDPRDAAFRQSEAILIVPVHTMFNGRSKFGVRGVNASRPLEVGTIIIDDAHACIPIIDGQFSLVLPRTTAAYKTLFSNFSESLRQQSLAGFTDLVDGVGSQALPVPYWSWQNSLEESYLALNSVTEDEDKTHQFRWPLIRTQLGMCDAAFSPTEVEIRLPYPDLAVVPSFINAKRRVFMTATLADDSVLVSRMGAAESCVTEPIAPASASDLGDRIILTPMETSRVISRSDVKSSLVRWSKNHNVVIIVPSRAKAKDWNDISDEIHDKDSIEDCVARLRQGIIGLVVLIARYDGLDLPNEACRVLVLDGLPERYSPQELVEAVAIGGTETMGTRQTQRIEQGMGRGVRSTDDYCAVLLLDPRLVERLHSAADRSQLSPATRAQYELSMQFSAAGRNKEIEFFDKAIEAFLSRDSTWTNASKQALENVTYMGGGSVDPVLIAERKAFTLGLSERSDEAFSTLSGVYSGIEDPQQRGWVKQRAAAYLHHVDPVRARAVQESARIDNSYILKTGQQLKKSRIRQVNDQAAVSRDFLSDTYGNSRMLELSVDALLADLQPSTAVNSHKKFEAALAKIGKIIGLASSRPDQETGVGPDNLWAIGDGKYWVIECKSEATASHVSLDYLQQLSGSMDWFDSVYSESRFDALPVLIHPSRQPMWDASVRKGARVMTFDRLADFRQAIRGFTTAIRVNNSYSDHDAVARNLEQFSLGARQLEQRWTQTFNKPAKP